VTANVFRVLSNIGNGFCKLKASNGTPPNLMQNGQGELLGEVCSSGIVTRSRRLARNLEAVPEGLQVTVFAGGDSSCMAEKPYVPHPIDTSHVSLSEVQPLLEDLARNAHEVWAQKRIADGWTLGAQRDDSQRKHPCLVPYEQLPESEKEYDRELVNQTLKTILALGYRIVKR
jgi:hypothetical protein